MGAIFAAAGAVLGGALLVNKQQAGAHEQQEASGALAVAEAD